MKISRLYKKVRRLCYVFILLCLLVESSGPIQIAQAARDGIIGNPPDPWADLGLRSGRTFLDFEGNNPCSKGADPILDAKEMTRIDGYTNKALQLRYDLGSGSANNRNWVQIKCEFDQSLDLSAYDHLRFDWQGSPTDNPAVANSLQVGLIDSRGHIFLIG